MDKYLWKQNSGYKVDSQIAGETLENIRQNNDGVIAPKIVVEESKPETAPAHRCFEWDNTKAADEYRLFQARGVIRNIRVVVISEDGDSEVSRVYANVTDEQKGRGYQTLVDIVKDDDLRQQALAYCAQMLANASERIANFKDMTKLVEHIQEVETKVIDFAMKEGKKKNKNEHLPQPSL